MCETLKKFEKSKKTLAQLIEDHFVGIGKPNENGVYLRMEKGKMLYSYSEIASTREKPVYYPMSN